MALLAPLVVLLALVVLLVVSTAAGSIVTGGNYVVAFVGGVMGTLVGVVAVMFGASFAAAMTDYPPEPGGLLTRFPVLFRLVDLALAATGLLVIPLLLGAGVSVVISALLDVFI